MSLNEGENKTGVFLYKSPTIIIWSHIVFKPLCVPNLHHTEYGGAATARDSVARIPPEPAQADSSVVQTLAKVKKTTKTMKKVEINLRILFLIFFVCNVKYVQVAGLYRLFRAFYTKRIIL